MSITLDHVQVLADQLSLLDKARLAAHLNVQLAQNLAARDTAPHGATTNSDSWERLLAFRHDIAMMKEDAPDFSAPLDTARSKRSDLN